MISKRNVEWLTLQSSPFTQVRACNLPWSKKLAKLIPDRIDKMNYLVSEMCLHPSVVDALRDKDLIVGPEFRTALVYCPYNGPCKAIKLFDHKSISEISKNKVRDFKRQSFKGFGVLSLNQVYRNNDKSLQKGHLIGAKLCAENEKAYWFSYNYLNVVPMYRAFNSKFYHKMEEQFLEFAQGVTRAGDTVCFIVSVSLNTRYDKQKRKGIQTEYSPFGNGVQINIPQSVSVIAYSLSEMGGVRKVFTFVGNNDRDFPEWHIPQDLSDLEDYYKQDGDVTSSRIIMHLTGDGYEMYHPMVQWPIYWPLHRSIYWPLHRSLYNEDWPFLTWPIHRPIYWPVHRPI